MGFAASVRDVAGMWCASQPFTLHKNYAIKYIMEYKCCNVLEKYRGCNVCDRKGAKCPSKLITTAQENKISQSKGEGSEGRGIVLSSVFIKY